jgi:hypothetical protein
MGKSKGMWTGRVGTGEKSKGRDRNEGIDRKCRCCDTCSPMFQTCWENAFWSLLSCCTYASLDPLMMSLCAPFSVLRDRCGTTELAHSPQPIIVASSRVEEKRSSDLPTRNRNKKAYDARSKKLR